MSKRSGVTGKTVEQLRRSKAGAAAVEERAKRTNEEQLALLDTRPGASVRERKRLS